MREPIAPRQHAPATTARAEPAALAREGDQSIEPAGGAPKASEAAGQAAAPQKVTKLLLDKAREAFAVTQRRSLGTERLEIVSDDPVQDGGRGIARLIGGRWLRHVSPRGARHATARNRESGLNVSCAAARSLRVTTAVAPSSDRSERKRPRRLVFRPRCAIRRIDASRNRGYSCLAATAFDVP